MGKNNKSAVLEDPKEEKQKHVWDDRNIEPEMVLFLDLKLKDNGLAQHAIANKDARLLFRLAAEACVGIREVGGNNRGPMVELIQDTVGDNKEPLAWCMSFVQTCLAYAEYKTGVKSPVFASEWCVEVWKKTSTKLRCTADPLPGAIIIWQDIATEKGHTGILTNFGQLEFTAIEGNTEAGINKGVVERDGGGVYSTKRNKAGTGKLKILGYLKPF